MAKKIRFPLEMSNGAQVRTLEELKEHFDLESVLEYYSSGKLLTWLRDRYIETEAGALEDLDSGAPDFQKKLCDVFGVEYAEEVDLEQIELRRERLARLRTVTDEEEFIDHIDQVAFDQEELADLLDDGVKRIYLCGDKFIVPVSQTGVAYVGICDPSVHLSGTIPEDMEQTGITFEGCAVDNWPEKAPSTVQDFLLWAKKEQGDTLTDYPGIKLTIQIEATSEGPEPVTIYGTTDDLLEKIGELCQRYRWECASKSLNLERIVLQAVRTDDEGHKELLEPEFTLKLDDGDSGQASAEVAGIHLDSGKKGYRTIQVDLKHPVVLDGVKYDHVPVLSHNLFEQMRLREGSTVNVHRVGDVIPSITVINEGNGKKIEAPEKCPSCGQHLIVWNKKLFCNNDGCRDNIIGKFMHFFDKMGMVGYSDAFAATLVDKLGCKNFVDVTKLTEKDFEIRNLTDKLSMSFAAVLHAAIRTHRDFEVIGAIGLPGMGPARAKELLKAFPAYKLINASHTINWRYMFKEAFIAAIVHLTNVHNDCVGSTTDVFYEEVLAIIEIGPKITENFDKVVRVGHTGGKLSDEIVKICNEKGYTIVDGISFDMLITTDADRSSSKMEAAKKKNLPIFLPADFVSYHSTASYVSKLMSAS